MTLLAALTIKVSAILLLALAAAASLRTRSASARHWVLAVGVVSAGAAPAFHFLPVLPLVEVAPADAGALGPAVASVAVTAVANHDDVGRLAVTIWLAGVVVSALVLLVGMARLRWLRASSDRVTDGPWHRLCSDLAQACGLKRDVDLLLGPRPGLVATWGWRRPAVVLPESASGWSAERMRIVLLHELAHARRGDWVVQMAAEGLRCVWWFNPLAWAVRAQLRRESEHAADDFVLARDVPAAACATHLVELARDVRKHRRTWLPAPAMARPSHLERRLSAMLNPHRNRRPMTRLARLGSLGALAAAAIFVASLQVADAVGQEPQVEPAGAAEAATAPGDESIEESLAAVAASQEEAATEVERAARHLEEMIAHLAAVQESLQAMLADLRTRSDDPARSVAGDAPIRIGEGVAPPRKIHDVHPTYPSGAREAGIEGVVMLDATIGPEGEVTDIEVLRSVPELDQAAIDAVEQWRWEPTLVDGEPVSILMTVTVNFTLR